ncbi:hypothetical protein [Halopiger goleimassiliensis]|uniref:hypothetical protein n=1 Tax=Halopiger goleimassiliensis TaxID=1293048 RepID=UPI000677D145|nr:hypothetical protein [Halopiger goleimassiliensis]
MDRRSVLQAAGGGAVLATVGLAGCLSAIPGIGGNDDTFESVAKWLPAPSAVNQDHYGVNTMDPYALIDAEDHLPDELNDIVANVEQMATEQLPGAASAEDVEYLVTGNFGPFEGTFDVIEGEFDAEEIEESLADESVTHVRTQGTFELYETDVTHVGITDGTIIVANTTTPTETAATVVETEAGDSPRYASEHDGFDALTDEIPPGDIGHVKTTDPIEDPDLENGYLTGVVAKGAMFDVEGEEVSGTLAMVFEDESVIDEEELETALEGDGLQPFSDYEIDGNVVRMTETGPTEEFLGSEIV